MPEMVARVEAALEIEANRKMKAEKTTFKKGDKVAWDSSQGEVTGKVEKKLTAPMQIKGHAVKASPENPEFLVKSEKTGAEAAHKPGELRKAR